MTNEGWRDGPFPGYRVGSLGTVVGSRGRPLTQSAAGPNGRGYQRVTIHPPGRILTRYVHTLVCAAFHGDKPSPRHHACHLDGNKLNNAAANLAWKLPIENEADKILHGTHNHVGELNPNRRLTAEAVEAIRSRYAAGGISQASLGVVYGVSQVHISRVISGRYWAPLDV